MRTKRAAVLTATSALFVLFFVLTARADTTPTVTYLVKDDAYSNGTYTAYVYLKSDAFVPFGTIGLEAGYADNMTFTLNADAFAQYDTLDSGGNYSVVQWQCNNSELSSYTDGLLLGTVTVTGLTTDSATSLPSGWDAARYITLKDWTQTSPYTQSPYTDVIDETTGFTINDQIYNSSTGLYRCAYLPDDAGTDADDFVDVGFTFTTTLSEVPEGVTVTGTILCYNSGEAPTVKLVDSASKSAYAELSEPTQNASTKQLTYAYTFENAYDGEYTLQITKPYCLTYTKTVTVASADIDETDAPIELYCGDLNGDGYIKLNDRSTLLDCINNRASGTAAARAADLNGDGTVTLHDLAIQTRYFNRKY